MQCLVGQIGNFALQNPFMHYLGETISIAVACSWTITALFAEVASKRIGPQALNVWRMAISLVLLGATLWFATGSVLPLHADSTTWLWLILSGLVGYTFGDFCLFNSYIHIGSRWGQLFMMLAPIAASFTAWILLDETLSLQVVLGMVVTLGGIAISVFNKQGDTSAPAHHIGLKLPLRGVLYGIGAGVGQGVGLVLSKIGMEHYETCIPLGDTDVSNVMPFASTMIRAVAGGVGLLAIAIVKGQAHQISHSLRDGRGMLFTLVASITGPFVGVALSLMALLYTSAGIAQTLMSLTPILILWPAHVFFGQRITWLEIFGALVSIAGVSLFFI